MVGMDRTFSFCLLPVLSCFIFFNPQKDASCEFLLLFIVPPLIDWDCDISAFMFPVFDTFVIKSISPSYFVVLPAHVCIERYSAFTFDESNSIGNSDVAFLVRDRDAVKVIEQNVSRIN